MENHNFELVHTTGRLQTKANVGDSTLNYWKLDTVKVKRDVEVYQWYEREEKDGDQKRYFYEKKWSNEKINQSHFEDPAAKHYAPSNPETWLMRDETFTNTQVELGQYQISKDQCSKLDNWENASLEEINNIILPNAYNYLYSVGWMQPLHFDGYIYTRQSNTHAASGGHIPIGPGNEIVGDMRIKYTFTPCCDVTVVAQQMEQPDKTVSAYTFRQWNPENTHAELGEDNGSSTDASCPPSCICCFIVEKCFKAVFQETVDEIHVGQMSADSVFNKMDAGNESTTKCFRILAWFMNVFGHYLLFSPIIALLAWIPLVGSLLAGIASVAAAIFSVVWGSLLHFLVLGVAWIVYRPLYGLLLLSAAGVCLGIMFYQK